ncbi:MAG TPA: threonine--tRNA ligase [Candidatus Nanoarchaeia archaeon]|nr:threonine--tRNA ligase [Candidatus Nanoarchaeia archaeon]
MITLEFPDGKKKEFKKGITALEVARSIGERLARDAICAEIDGKLLDLGEQLKSSGKFRILTFKDEKGIEVFRHSTAHVMAQAIMELYPDALLTIGPVVEEGFYYDIDIDTAFHPDDLEKIEKKMEEIVRKDLKIERKALSKKEAMEIFKHNPYKVELLGEFEGEISAYSQGDFIDLCRGPHVPSTGYIKAFKLTKIAGAYWHGDAKNKQLQRIYGISFPEKKLLDEHLRIIEEARKRDHRVIGQKLDLFSFDEISPGAPFFHPKGAIIFNELLKFLREEYKKRGYKEVITPLIYGKQLWETSGHWQHFKENMFIISVDGREAALKPMNCPSHCLIYKKGFKSYRELPLRIADFASLHRNEIKGVLGGMTRVRKFSQDDAHIFVTPEQLEDEMLQLMDFTKYIYKEVFDFDYDVELSTKPEKALGSEELWQKAEKGLADALKKKKLGYKIKPGEGAFYGPKIDFHIKDALGRSWQLATIQLDFNLPERFGLEYEDKDGGRKTPIMIHRALLGSIERFMAILIEHYAGRLPLWLSPVHVRLLTVANRFDDYAEELKKELENFDIRAELDNRPESIPKKVREAQLMQVPVIVTIGEKEVSKNTVAIRTLDGKVKFDYPKAKFVEAMMVAIEKRRNLEL